MKTPKAKKLVKFVKAWGNQSKILVQVQKTGGDLEKQVAAILGWGDGRVVYDLKHKYTVQVDNVFPDVTKPEVVLSVTYTSPDQKGHSNENKHRYWDYLEKVFKIY